MCSHDEFMKLTTNFILLNCDNNQNETTVCELHNLLNELNSQDYQKQKFVDSKTATMLVESFTNIPTNEDALVMKSCCLLVTLLNKQKIQLSRDSFKKIVDWLLKCLQLNFQGTACEVLSMLQALFKNHSAYCTEYWGIFLSPDGSLMNILGNRTDFTANHCGAQSFNETLHSTMFCIESLVVHNDGLQLTDSLNNLLTTTGTKVLEFLYSKRFKTENTISFVKYITSSINIVYKVASENQIWCDKNLGSLIGLSKAYMHYGLPDMIEMKPQKVHISQQSISESPIAHPSKGGKVAKAKKPRMKQISKLHEQSDQSSHNETLTMDFDNSVLTYFNKASDSDFSESEVGRVQNERHKQGKLRLSAISLLALIAKDTEKKTLYGYWHSLFPSEPLTHTSTGLLNCVVRDPNPRCRLAALQAASWMFFGSRNYLLQAECSDKAPTSFMPFSISLGNMILSIYNGLTQAISTEISIPVLTQILKCFTVLIQATPFNRLKSGFVSNFVKYIRKLVCHKDPTVQVAALRVMEFLISRQDITVEISACVEMPKFSLRSARTNQNQLNDLAIAQLTEPELEEEFFDSDYEEESIEIKNNDNCNSNSGNTKMSWLLQIVLENLGVTVENFKVRCSPATIPIRIQSLQVLSSMAPHFVLLKDYLDKVAMGLKISLDDPQLEVQLATGKCLDIIGDSINSYLLEIVTPSPDIVMACKDFWLEILPVVIPKIQDPGQNSALKAVLCDFI